MLMKEEGGCWDQHWGREGPGALGKLGTPDWQEQKCCPSNMGRIVGKGRREAGRLA